MIDPETWSDITSTKKSHFPYVQKCQQCIGCGYNALYMWWYETNEILHCEKCEGRGWTIPTEWFGH